MCNLRPKPTCHICIHEDWDESGSICRCSDSEYFKQPIEDDKYCDKWDGDCSRCDIAGEPLFLRFCCDCDWEDDENDESE